MSGTGYALEGARVRLGDTWALDGVDLAVAPGEHVALIGPSGAGKTTLLRVLAAAARADAGTARIDGRTRDERSSRDLRALRADIGFVHQDHALVPVQSALTNVLAGRLGRGGALRTLFPSRVARRAAHAVLERVGIGDLLYRRVDQLSGGQQQRVAVARALFQEPRALLADEPVAAVDPERARTVIDLLTGVASERDATLVVSLHDVDLARSAFPRIVALRGGRVAFDARADAGGGFPDLDGGALTALFAREEPTA